MRGNCTAQSLPSSTLALFNWPQPNVLFFDLMGTCLDWHSGIVPARSCALSSSLNPKISLPDLSKLATDWRVASLKRYIDSSSGDPSEGTEVTHRRVLDRLLEEKGIDLSSCDEDVRNRLVDGWHG